MTHPRMTALAPQLIANADIESFEAVTGFFVAALAVRLEHRPAGAPAE